MSSLTESLLTRCVAVCVALAAAPAGALASSSPWHEAEGGSIRLVTSGGADENGLLRGALVIELKPGWKTYWLDPGDAGVPPTLDVSASDNVASAEMSFPAPHRYDDGFARWAGYSEPVTFAVTFKLTDPKAPATIRASVFLGICETICVPVQATLEVDPGDDAGNADDAADVEAAFESLPAPEQPDFGVTPVEGGKDEIVVEVAFPGEAADVDFFLGGVDGYLLAPPERREADGKLMFSVHVIERPQTPPTGGGLPYTLVAAGGAVSGILPYPPHE